MLRDRLILSVRFEALTVEDVRTEVQQKYAADSIFTLEEKNRHTELSGGLDILERRKVRWGTKALVATNIPGPPTGPFLAPTQVLIRGNYLQPGESVEPGFPTAIAGDAKPAVLETDRYRQFPTRGRRLTLAKWIASPENPLTARVMVNRIWQHHFGQGIVRTTERLREERRASDASGIAGLAGCALCRVGLEYQGDAPPDTVVEHVSAVGRQCVRIRKP